MTQMKRKNEIAVCQPNETMRLEPLFYNVSNVTE